MHLRGFGGADQSGRAVTPHSPFVFASVSKSFTAPAVMQLVEAGKIELGAPVQRYLPWFCLIWSQFLGAIAAQARKSARRFEKTTWKERKRQHETEVKWYQGLRRTLTVLLRTRVFCRQFLPVSRGRVCASPLWGDQVVQSVFSIGVLAWLGWLRLAGFNCPSQWRSLHLLWLPGLWALFILFSFLFTTHVSSAMMVVLLALFVLLNGLREEALFRGVILQVLLPYGWLRAAALSALVVGGLCHTCSILLFPLSCYKRVIVSSILYFDFWNEFMGLPKATFCSDAFVLRRLVAESQQTAVFRNSRLPAGCCL